MHIHQICWIVTKASGELQRCHIVDVSDYGAKILCENVGEIPDKFFLLLTQDRKVMRECLVLWRAEKEMELRFLGKRSWSQQEVMVIEA